MAFSGIPIAAPVAAPQAGINYSPMDQVGNLFAMLPALAKLLGNQNNQNQQNQANNQSAQAPNPENSLVNQLGAGTPGAASSSTAGALTTGQPQMPRPIAPTPVSYAGTGYNPNTINQIPRIGAYGPQGPGATPGAATPGVPSPGMANPQAMQTLIQMLQQGNNPYALSNNPYAQAPGGMGSGLRNPAAGY